MVIAHLFLASLLDFARLSYHKDKMVPLMINILFTYQKELGTILGTILLVIWLYVEMIKPNLNHEMYTPYLNRTYFNFTLLFVYEIIKTFEIFPETVINLYPQAILAVSLTQIQSQSSIKCSNVKQIIILRILTAIPLLASLSSKNTELLIFLMFNLLSKFWNPVYKMTFGAKIMISGFTIQIFYLISGVNIDVNAVPQEPRNLFFGCSTVISPYLSFVKVGYCCTLGVMMTYYQILQNQEYFDRITQRARKNMFGILLVALFQPQFLGISLNLIDTEHFTQAFVFSNYVWVHFSNLLGLLVGYLLTIVYE